MDEKPTPKDLAWLAEMQSGHLLGHQASRAVPSPIRTRLEELGLIENQLAGWVVTDKGKKAVPG